MKRRAFALLLTSCGTESAGEIDLVLENQTASPIVAQESTPCGTSHVQILDETGQPVIWRCGQVTTSARAIETSDFAAPEPVICTESVRQILPTTSLLTRWNGLSFGDTECDVSSQGPFEAQFCFGTRSSTRASALTGQTESIVNDLRCERVSFQLGVDLEARYVAK